MSDLLAQMESELSKVQIELVQADIAANEATARAESAQGACLKLEAAVAALKGESPVEPPAPEVIAEEIPQSDERAANAAMSEEEFDAQRKRRQRKRQKELDALNPLADYKCAGCGVVGKSTEQIVTAPSGSPVRLIGCSACGNQTF